MHVYIYLHTQIHSVSHYITVGQRMTVAWEGVSGGWGGFSVDCPPNSPSTGPTRLCLTLSQPHTHSASHTHFLNTLFQHLCTCTERMFPVCSRDLYVSGLHVQRPDLTPTIPGLGLLPGSLAVKSPKLSCVFDDQPRKKK